MKSILTVCFLILSSWVFAQEEDEITADSLEYFLSEIVVSANRWEQNLLEVPGKVSKISGDAIKFQNPQTAADLLSVSNSVFIQKSQLGGGSPMIRGFATNRVLLVVDGIRMNNAIFRSGNVQNVISLDANVIEEAEVVFGPGSAVYGSDAIGGVMDFHTLKPKFSDDKKSMFSLHSLTRYSSANKEKTAHVDFNIGFRKLAFLTSITRSVYDDLKMGSNGPQEYTRPDYVVRKNNEDIVLINGNPDVQVLSGYNQWNGMQKISFQPNQWFNTSYAFHYSKTSDYPRYDRLTLKEDEQFVNAQWYYGPQQWIMHSLNLTYIKPSPLFDQAKVTIGLQRYKESRHNRSLGSSRRTDRHERVNAFSANLDLDRILSDLLTVYYGAEFITNKVNSTAKSENINSGQISGASTRYPNNSDWRTYAAYLSLKLKPGEKWLINLSNRFTNVDTHATYDKTFFDFPFDEATLRNKSINGSLGLIYTPTPVWKFYLNISSGFRAPNVDDIGKVFDSEPGNVVVPNPKLEPEQAYNAELGTAGFVTDKIKIDLAAYYTTINNAIARSATTFNGQDSIDYDGVLSSVLSLQNISEVWVTGIQAGLDWEILEGLKFSSTINYQKGKEKDPETGRNFSPTHVAPVFGSTHIQFSNTKWKTDLYANYNGEISYNNLALTERADGYLYAKDANGNPYSPGWLTLNFKSAYRLNANFSFDLGIENILNKRYRPYSSGISAAGRNFIVALRATL